MHRARLLALLLLSALLLAAPAAHGASNGLVVSQVYAGGGNSGATYANDFVELFNRGSAAVDLTGWTVQYATSSGTTWQPTSLSGSVAPGHYFLVQLASAGAVGATLPPPDATGTTNLAASGGKVAVAHDATALSCGATAGSCSASPAVVDLVGYGSATDYEGSGPAPALGNTTAALRGGAGCADTDVNAADFASGPPAPRNAASPAATCGTALPPAGTGVSQGAAVDIQVQPLLTIALERSSVGFGSAAAGETPAPVSERVTVLSNNATGYALTVHRSAFTPADLPLALSSTAPSGAQLGGALAGGALAPLPIAPTADLLVGTTAAQSAAAGDVWPASLGFSSPLPVVAAGRYTATVTFTVIGR
ncbi:MAG: uncharacterized protein V7644_2066 [Actinomycetota bacterium]|jgi:hypothetical protein